MCYQGDCRTICAILVRQKDFWFNSMMIKSWNIIFFICKPLFCIIMIHPSTISVAFALWCKLVHFSKIELKFKKNLQISLCVNVRKELKKLLTWRISDQELRTQWGTASLLTRTSVLKLKLCSGQTHGARPTPSEHMESVWRHLQQRGSHFVVSVLEFGKMFSLVFLVSSQRHQYYPPVMADQYKLCLLV